MSISFKRVVLGSVRSIPTLITLGILAGVGWLGHHWKWTVPSKATVLHGPQEVDRSWCLDHGVLEAVCITCRGFKVTATPPSALLSPGGKEAAMSEPEIEEPPVADGKPRPVVQVPSVATLRAAGIETGVAETRAISESIEANAESGYDMSRYAQVAARAPGHAAIVRARAGQRVQKGEVLALIDCADVGKAKAEFLQASTTLASRRAVLARMETSTTAGFRNQTDLVAAEADVKEADIRASSARQALGNLGLPAADLGAGAPTETDLQFLGVPAEVVAELDAAHATANLLPIRAPLDGVVVSQNVVSGEVIDPTRTLFVVADTSRMWLTVDLPPSQARSVKIGQPLEFRPDGWTGASFAGDVTWISTEASEKTRTVPIRAELANAGGELLAHLFGRARITVRAPVAALVVPAEAVQPDGQNFLVFVRLNDEVFRPRIVTIGAQSDGFIEILSGLAPGETVATSGSSILAAQANRGKLGAGCCAAE